MKNAENGGVWPYVMMKKAIITVLSPYYWNKCL